MIQFQHIQNKKWKVKELPKLDKASHSLRFFLKATCKSPAAALAIFCTREVLICPQTHKLMSNSPRLVCRFSLLNTCFSNASAVFLFDDRPENVPISSILTQKLGIETKLDDDF